jgi:hypothetical protein
MNISREKSPQSKPQKEGGIMIAKSQSSLMADTSATLEHLWYWTSATLTKGSSGNFYLTVQGPKSTSFLNIRLSFRENTKDPIPVPVYDIILHSATEDYALSNESYSVVDTVKVSTPNSNGSVSVDLNGMQLDPNDNWKGKRIRLNIQTR